MKDRLDIFCEITCLTEKSVSLRGLDLRKKWFNSADKKMLGHYLQTFINLNVELFTFLGVQPFLVGTDHNSSICFRSSNFVGTIPLRSPHTGKQIGDFVVSPRFVGRDRYQDYVEILDLLGSEISPQFTNSLPLASGKIFRPPLYLEAVKFITSLENVVKKPWRKFDNIKMVFREPTGTVNWDRYAKTAYRVENRLTFPVRKNVLSELHEEFAEIRYVFDLCNQELLSPNTPSRIRASFNQRLSFIAERLYQHNPKKCEVIEIRAADRVAVKDCKKLANTILKRDSIDGTAWRVDFNDVFEKFVQYIFSHVAKSIGGRLVPNLKIHSKGTRRFAWELAHIEPDAVLIKERLCIYVDAKYKSHLFNKYNHSDLLKNDHRRDLHQIFAYSSFSNERNKIAVICYPSNEIEVKSSTFKNQLTDTAATLLIFGLPLNKQIIPDAVRVLIELVNKLNSKFAVDTA